MEEIKSFVVNLITILIFMTAVEIIAPDNSMKKYLNFILGLILISFLLSPIVIFFTSGETILSEVISENEKNLSFYNDNDYKVTSEKNLKEEEFKDSFEEECNELLREKFGDMGFESKIYGSVNFEKMKFTAQKLDIYLRRNNASDVSVMNNQDNLENRIKEFINSEVKLDREKIHIYYI